MPFNHNNPVVERNILKMRLIGQQCEIKYAKKLFSGQIKNETKNTWQIKTIEGLKTIPKDQSILRLKIDKQIFEINGTQMKGRHEDRLKRMRKRKW